MSEKNDSFSAVHNKQVEELIDLLLTRMTVADSNEKELEFLKNRLDIRRTLRREMEHDLDQEIDEAAKFQRTRDDLAIQLTSLRNKRHRISSINDNSQDPEDLTSLKIHLDAINAEIKAEENKSLQLDTTVLDNNNADDSWLTEIDNEIERLTRSNLKIEEEITSLTSEYEEITADMNKFKHEICVLNADIEDLNRLTRQYHTWKQFEWDKLQEAEIEFEQNRMSSASTAERGNSMFSEIIDANKRTHNELLELYTEKMDLKKRNYELSIQLNTARDQLKFLKTWSENDSLTKILLEYVEKELVFIGDRINSLKLVGKVLSELISQRSRSMDAKIKQIKNDCENIKKNIESMKRSSEKIDGEKWKLRGVANGLPKLRNDIRSMEEELNNIIDFSYC